MITQAARLRVYKVPLVDPERAIDDPALAALHAEGWAIAASFLASEGESRFLVFVLVPPRPKADDGVLRKLDATTRAMLALQFAQIVVACLLLGMSIAASLP